jgi:hypothetical protein
MKPRNVVVGDNQSYAAALGIEEPEDLMDDQAQALK